MSKHTSVSSIVSEMADGKFEVKILTRAQSMRKRNSGIFSSISKQTLPEKDFHGLPASATAGVQGQGPVSRREPGRSR